MSINKQEFTNAGRDMLGRANNGEHLTFTHVVVGSGVANAPDDLWDLEELPPGRLELEVPITQQEDLGDGILIIDCVFRSDDPNITRRFELREIGPMAHIDNEPPRLYSIANVLATTPDVIDPDPLAPRGIYAFKIKVIIDRAQNVTIVIGESRDILGENIGPNDSGAGWFANKLANTLRFKRAVEGYGIQLLEEPERITIGQRIIDLDLDVIVSRTPQPGEFLDLPAALRYVRDLVIPPERKVRIIHRAGVWHYDDPIEIYHPFAQQIEILGVPIERFQSTGAGQGAIAAVPGGYIYHVNINPIGDLANLAVGDFVTLHALTGRYAGGGPGVIGTPSSMDYCHALEIHSLTGTGVNVLTYGYTLPGKTFSDGNVSRYPTILRWTGNNAGFRIRNCKLGLMENLFIVGDRLVGEDNIGIYTDTGASVKLGEHIAVRGFDQGLVAERSGSYITGRRVFVHGAFTRNVVADYGGQIDLTHSFISGAGQPGRVEAANAVGNNGGVLVIYFCYVSNSHHLGILASLGTVFMNLSWATGNAGAGVWSAAGSRIGADGTKSYENFTAGVADNYKAENHSFIQCNPHYNGGYAELPGITPPRNVGAPNLAIVVGNPTGAILPGEWIPAEWGSVIPGM